MTHFPVTNSNLSATHLGLFLQEKYALSKDTKCQLIKAGINDTYLVTDDTDKYVFRVYSLDWRTKTEIEEEIRLLNQLKENGISISYPLPDKKTITFKPLMLQKEIDLQCFLRLQQVKNNTSYQKKHISKSGNL